MSQVIDIKSCISKDEKKQRLTLAVSNGIAWIALSFLIIGSMGTVLIFMLIGWVASNIFAEMNVKKLQAIGTSVSPKQFPEINSAVMELSQRFQLEKAPKVIVVASGEINAFAVKFARKRVIVLLSETLEGVIDNPKELRFLIGHEMGHMVLDHNAKSFWKLYSHAAFKAGREMTCDNCGVAACGNLEASKTMLKRLGVGNKLHDRLDDQELYQESQYIYSGISGYLLKQQLTYPPLGKRIAGIMDYAKSLRQQPAVQER